MAGHPFIYVYLLRSEKNPRQTYVGITSDLRQRLTEHNAGKAKHTSKFRPWKLETYIAFSDVEKARTFEKYLKSSSGIAFANKRLRSLAGTESEEGPTESVYLPRTESYPTRIFSMIVATTSSMER